MHFVYILYSEKFNKYYVEETEDMPERLRQHIEHTFRGASTVYTDDWKLKKLMTVGNRKEGRIVEKYIKAMKSRKFIEAILTSEESYKRFCTAVNEKFSISIL